MSKSHHTKAKKEAAPEIVVEVENGMVVRVFSTIPGTKVFVADHDVGVGKYDWQRFFYNEAVERAQQPDMYKVYGED